jgi:hypothetical protein
MMGQYAITLLPVQKNRKTRNIDYELGARETRSYEASISKLLNKSQRLSETRAGVVKVSGIFVVVRYEGGTYKGYPIFSNTLRIEIAPQWAIGGRAFRAITGRGVVQLTYSRAAHQFMRHGYDKSSNVDRESQIPRGPSLLSVATLSGFPVTHA